MTPDLFGHDAHVPVYMDEDLMIHDAVWAAAGTPDTLFTVPPHALADAVGARIVKLA